MPITIHITGPVGSGKTTIAPIITKALHEAGLHVIYKAETPDPWHLDGRALDEIRGTTVTVLESTTVRPPRETVAPKDHTP